MSLTFEIRGKKIVTWQIIQPIGSQVGRLSSGDTKKDTELVFGGEDDGPGIERTINREDVLRAVENILPAAKALASGFQIRVPPYDRLNIPEQVGAGLACVVKGKGYVIRCRDDYWQIRSSEEFQEMMKNGKYKKVPKHYEASEIVTENWGVIRVEPRKRGGHDLAWLLRQIKKFLESDPSEKVTIIWG